MRNWHRSDCSNARVGANAVHNGNVPAMESIGDEQKVMAITPFASGRAGSAQIDIQINGLYPMLKKWSAADPMFNKEIRSASIELINEVVSQAQVSASYSPNPRQATEAAKGLRPRPDRIPIVRLSSSSAFVSTTRPNRKRKKKVTRGDVFFGSEFGSSNFTQFPARSPRLGGGNRGYWFWPTIEAMAPTINRKYFQALDRITNRLEKM